MRGATTIEKESSDARGCDTEDDFALTTEIVAEGVVEVCLSCASRTMKEEDLARVSGDGMDDLIKGSSLVRIESVDALCPQLNLLFKMVRPLLCDERVPDDGTPILLDLRYVRPIVKRRIEHLLDGS